ncbi:hypothetical protein [Kurthia zopfii]|uniref:hypothetical protein n=1 Tax=Kurthia zopfii TaxID=1650 RepID=UPI000F6E9EE6|nr:hypothetical protein [Kurthia zopfii]VEI07182.1 Uncharacterised protein [Kurthia zopfii]
MRVIICEEDYSYIEIVHSTLEKYATLKGINAEFNLTTRKPSSVIKSLSGSMAEFYYISLDLSESIKAEELIEAIRKEDQNCLIVALSQNPESFNAKLIEQYNIFATIDMSDRTTMTEQLKSSLVDGFQHYKSLNYFV